MSTLKIEEDVFRLTERVTTLLDVLIQDQHQSQSPIIAIMKECILRIEKEIDENWQMSAPKKDA